MPSDHFENFSFEISTHGSKISCQKQCHIWPDSKVRSHCHLVVKVRNSPKLAHGLTAIVHFQYLFFLLIKLFGRWLIWVDQNYVLTACLSLLLIFIDSLDEPSLGIPLFLFADYFKQEFRWFLERRKLRSFIWSLRAQQLINLEIPVLIRSLKSSNVELG